MDAFLSCLCGRKRSMQAAKEAVQVSKLPMRQKTRQGIERGTVAFSKLPMRQKTFGGSCGSYSCISKLPMRQKTRLFRLSGPRQRF